MTTIRTREPHPFERNHGCTCEALSVHIGPIAHGYDGAVRIDHEDSCPLPATLEHKMMEGLVEGVHNTIRDVEMAEPYGPWADALRDAVAELLSVTETYRSSHGGVCHTCGGQFERQRSTARYCSDRCRQAAHRARNA